MAHLLTAIRLVICLPFAVFVANGSAGSAGLCFLVAIATDLLDGPVARATGTATPLGGLFDHATDFAFVMSGLVAGALRGAFPLWLPIAIAIAFTQYVVDSYWLHRAGRLRMSRLGRANGVLYFFPLAGEILVGLPWGLGFLAGPTHLLTWALVVTTAVSIVDRAVSLERPDRSGGRDG